jgi:hypothetical protein
MGATSFLCACTIYSPDLLKNTDPLVGGSGAAGAGNPCATGSTCAEAGKGGSAGAGGSSGAGGSTGAGGDPVDAGLPATVPYIQSTTLNPNIGVGLSEEGTLDWAHWGLTMATSYNHKNLAKPLLSTLASAGTRPVTLYMGVQDTTFAWSDGIPTVSGMSSNGVAVAGVNEGFVVTAPAAAEVRLLRLYVGVMAGTALIQAKLSDPKATDAMLTDVLTSKTDSWVKQVITIEYQDAAPGTTVSVRWTVQSGNDAGTMPAVHLKAVTLAPKPVL